MGGRERANEQKKTATKEPNRTSKAVILGTPFCPITPPVIGQKGGTQNHYHRSAGRREKRTLRPTRPPKGIPKTQKNTQNNLIVVTQPLSSYFGIILGPWGTPRPTQTPPRSAKTAPRPPQDGSNKVPDDKPKNETKTKKN